MRTAFEALGEQPPGIALRCVNAIPHGFGLGSSAAAIVAGMLAARALRGAAGMDRLPDEALLGLAAELEGHADNVAACLAGGLTIAWGDGRSRLGPVRPARSAAGADAGAVRSRRAAGHRGRTAGAARRRYRMPTPRGTRPGRPCLSPRSRAGRS